MAGSVKIPRSALTEELWRNGKVARLYLYLLAMGGTPLTLRGMAEETKMTLQEVRTALRKLQNRGLATQKPLQKSTSKKNIFVPPSEEEVETYVREKGYHFNPAQFVPYYKKQGWKQANGQPIKDWRACMSVLGSAMERETW